MPHELRRLAAGVLQVRSARELREKALDRWRVLLNERLGRRDFVLDAKMPYVSFTFDDFPRSAFVEGGRILASLGTRGTYFTAHELLGRQGPLGEVASADDLRVLVQEGHELGCHTFEHLDGWRATAQQFERSIAANAAALNAITDGRLSPVFAYPFNGPVLRVKRVVGPHFVSCRGGGQVFNAGRVDLNLLKAFFLDWRNRERLDAVRRVIDQNAAARGWLIFATHDVVSSPSRFGCEPGYFEAVVSLAIQSGARVVPMMQACRELGIAAGERVATAEAGANGRAFA
jgi:peptidoglycan/xylan/chitin deacetylase (PgdA/CDA1 family)